MLRPKWLLVLLAYNMLSWSCLAVFEVEKMGLRVVYPKDDRASYDMALANFGEPVYGATLMGTLMYPSSDPSYNKGVSFTCTPVPCEYGCTFFNESKPHFLIKKDPGHRHIMLLDRGPRMDSILKPCTFLEKVWHAQLAGADAVIYGNDKEGGLLTPDIPDDVGLASMLPDIRIPAGFITLQDSNQLKGLMKKGPVTLVLNWTSILPRSPKVHWEFWTNSNDECGTVCTEQQRFIKDIKPTAIALQKAGHASFEPHYLLWSCPEDYLGSETCASQCIRNGTYCCPDPDDNIHQGYSGADVLWMNVRSLCFYRLANQSSQPWLWWDFADALGEKCSMGGLRFMPECAQQVFDAAGGPKLADGKGREEWTRCIGGSDQSATGPIQMLEDELAAQHGEDGSSTVAILPTIRVNGAQYRGTLDSKAVIRALCSAFPFDREPELCNNEQVSEDECKEGRVGYQLCHNG